MSSEPMSPSSLKQKLKSSLCISGCFRQINHHNGHIHGHNQSTPTSPRDNSSRFIPSPSPRNHSAKLKSPRLSRTLSKSQEKCKNLINWIGNSGGGSGRHVRRHTADFHYDALSYSLNFDRGCAEDDLDQFPLRKFSARLPQSPPPSGKSPESSSAARDLFAVHNV